MSSSFRSYYDVLKDISTISEDEFSRAVELILECLKNGNVVWIIGNGGSASTADHFETDLSFIRNSKVLPKIRAVSLTSNNSLLSAIANDIGFDKVFSHQLKRKASTGDLLVAISASGNSQNIVKAIEYANGNGIVTLSIVGFDGGTIAKTSNQAIHVKSAQGLYGQVEDLHLSICHALANSIAIALNKSENI